MMPLPHRAGAAPPPRAPAGTGVCGGGTACASRRASARGWRGRRRCWWWWCWWPQQQRRRRRRRRWQGGNGAARAPRAWPGPRVPPSGRGPCGGGRRAAAPGAPAVGYLIFWYLVFGLVWVGRRCGVWDSKRDGRRAVNTDRQSKSHPTCPQRTHPPQAGARSASWSSPAQCRGVPCRACRPAWGRRRPAGRGARCGRGPTRRPGRGRSTCARPCGPGRRGPCFKEWARGTRAPGWIDPQKNPLHA